MHESPHLGAGASGSDVYAATRGDSTDVLAVKVLRGESTKSACGLARFVREATLGTSTLPTRAKILCESLDALILEQRDLTFGKRAQHLVIWRVAKSPKRLRRLVAKKTRSGNRRWGCGRCGYSSTNFCRTASKLPGNCRETPSNLAPGARRAGLHAAADHLGEDSERHVQ